MRQTKESNKRAPGRVVIYISVRLVLIYTLIFSNVLLVGMATKIWNWF